MAVRETYRLQTLLELRDRSKQQAEIYLAECLGALKQEQDRLKEMRAELERMQEKRKAKRREYSEQVMRGEMSAQDALAAEKYIKRLIEREEEQKDAITGQEEVVKQRETDVKQARDELAARMRELKALEKHREKWEERVKKEIQNKEEIASDELGQAIFRAKQEAE